MASKNPYKTVISDEGTVFTPWTDGWAVGFVIHNPNRPDLPARFVYLNPSGGCDTGDLMDSDVFLYHDSTGEPDSENAVCFINVWDKDASES